MVTDLPDEPGAQDNRAEPIPGHAGEVEILKSLVAVFSEFAEQEKQRTAIQREVALRGVEISEIGEQRQYDLSLKQIEYADIQHQRRYGLGRLLLVFAGIAVLILLALVGLVVAMAFFGSSMQSQTALTLLGYGFAAIGGGGILFLVMYACNALVRWWNQA